MDSDNHGDLGFAEAMVAMMAVTVVISLYLVFAATTSIAAYDPMDGFDPDALDVRVDDGVRISESYMFTCLGTMDIRGIRVCVSIPYFVDEGSIFTVGSETDLPYSQTYMRVLGYDNGRQVPVIIEVVAYG